MAGRTWLGLSQRLLVLLASCLRWLDSTCWHMGCVRVHFHSKSPYVKRVGFFDVHLLSVTRLMKLVRCEGIHPEVHKNQILKRRWCVNNSEIVIDWIEKISINYLKRRIVRLLRMEIFTIFTQKGIYQHFIVLSPKPPRAGTAQTVPAFYFGAEKLVGISESCSDDCC